MYFGQQIMLVNHVTDESSPKSSKSLYYYLYLCSKIFSNGSEKINSTGVLGSFSPIEQEEGYNIILVEKRP